MPQLLSINDIVEVSFVCNLLNQFSYNVQHFKVTAQAGFTVDDADVADFMDTTFAPLYKAILPTGCQWWGAKAQIIKPVRFDAQVDSGNRGNGAVVGDVLPTQTAGLVSLKTGFANRSKQGRMYLPPSSEADNVAAAAPSAAYLAGAAAIANNMIIPLNLVDGAGTATLRWTIYSRKLLSDQLVTSFEVKPDWATIRRRSHIRHDDAVPF